MQRILTLGLVVAGIAACDSATSKDPETLSRDALNPPSGLVTVTGDQKIELRWQAMNAEEDFKGYRVFAVAKKLADLNAPTYPTGYTLDKLKAGSVPRCDKNTALFEAFGFPAIKTGEKDCEGDAVSDSGASGTAKSFNLTADAASAASSTDPDALPPEVVKCYDSTDKELSNTQLSLPATTPALQEQSCIVKALGDGTALANGTTYTFFVAAIIANDAFDDVQISWTSNFVEDTPATLVFQGTVELEVRSMKYLPLESLTEKKLFTELGTAECDTNSPTGCQVYKNNKRTPSGIYFGRMGNEPYPQRTFISATEGTDLALLLRGPQTYDPRKGDKIIASSIPQDQAISVATSYDTTGLPQPIYGNQVFDYIVTIGNEPHYGKIIIENVSLKFPENASSLVSYDIKVLLQTAPKNPHYLREH